jgi:hypothetical protein
MIPLNRDDPSTATIPAPAPSDTIQVPRELPPPVEQTLDFATRGKLRARQQFQQNRFVIVGAGALITALLIFVAVSRPHNHSVRKTKVGTAAVKDEMTQSAIAGADRSLFPVTDSGRLSPKEAHDGFLDEKDLERSVTRRSHASSVPAGPSNAPGTLGSIPPFGPDQPGWQAPPYKARATDWC